LLAVRVLARLVHIEDVGGTQLIYLSQEVADWAGEIASAHAATLTHGPPASLGVRALSWWKYAG
jgi:hypothetical protein